MTSENLKFSELRGMGGSTAEKIREVGRGQVIQSFIESVQLMESHGGILPMCKKVPISFLECSSSFCLKSSNN